MKRIYICCSIVFILVISFTSRAQEDPELEKPQWYPVLEDALESGMLSISDITVKRDFIAPDPFRLKISIDWLEEPFLIPLQTQEIAKNFSETKKLADIFCEVSKLKDNDTSSVTVVFSEPTPETLYINLKKLQALSGGKFKLTQRSFRKSQKKLPTPVIEALSVLVEAAVIAHEEANKAYDEMTSDEVTYLLTNISKITTEGQTPDTDMPEKLYGLAKKVKQEHIAVAAKVMCIATDNAREYLSALDKAAGKNSILKGKSPFRIDTAFGPIIIGGLDKDIYSRNAFIIIDIGGNDEYRGNSGSVTSLLNGVSIIIDLEGNDLYHTNRDYAIASAIGGFAIIVDEDGDDEYTGAHHVEASGTFGLGMLADAKGIDRYFADTASQATGYWGYGILIDYEGNDFYTAHMNSQAHAQVSGAAFLIDFAGNDIYITGNKYKDYRQGQKYYGTLSQGFAIGARPNHSAGIGGLFDFGGNDNYICDVFGQGSSYWFGVGILYDEAGDDRYIARRYSQGAGIHLSTGALVDMAGNDKYIAWGVSQGCGHDISQGMLFDASGNDSYYAESLSQGAGNANGFGIMIDLDGNDRYISERSNTQAAGTYKKKEKTYARGRPYTGIGILIDANGKDYYTNGGKNNTFWRNGHFGVGYDTTKPPAVKDKVGAGK